MKFTLNDIHFDVLKLNLNKDSIVIIKIDESENDMINHVDEIRSTTDQITNALDKQIGMFLPVLIIPRNYSIHDVDKTILQELIDNKNEKPKKIRVGQAYD